MVTADLFRQALGNWGTGVTIVATSGDGGKPYGLTVSSFTSVSLDPPLILVCLDNRISGLQAFKDSEIFGVSVLAEGQDELSTLFAKKDSVRPADLYFTGKTGAPLIRGSLVGIECKTHAMYPGGDHQILVGEVEAVEFGAAKEGTGPLLYFRGKYGKLG
ncbi:MAG TPA: flavin reductase family protein [Terriglobia bacterium]|nr:flavin reductase family protein [Terriglobia bacterium]